MNEHNNFESKSGGKTILVAPLHWGLGHATRCIPIINALLKYGFNVLLGSDGAALLLLRKEFPQLEAIELPSYDITYATKGRNFKWQMMQNIPKIKKAISSEKKLIKRLFSERKIDGIISDNRFGVRHKSVPSVFITHQLKVLSGNTSGLSSKIHQKLIKKFNECWVPDTDKPLNLSGKLGRLKSPTFIVRYIGPLSRMQKVNLDRKYDILLLLSGPEPQRTLLEEKLLTIFKGQPKKVLLVRGVVEDQLITQEFENITSVNYMETEALEKAINQSGLVISRSGYTTIMDLAALEKMAFFIPTPGQYEQKYLAKRLSDQGIVPSCKQKEFTLDQLEKIPLYQGLKAISSPQDITKLFRLFEGE